MQKKLIALAVAGLASTAAFAQSNVTVYGVADLGEAWVKSSGAAANGANQGGVTRLDNNSSYIGFKGAEALGNGLTAVFQFETGVNADVGGFGAGRDTYIGLAGGFGTVAAGNLTHPLRTFGFKAELMPGVSGIGTMSSVTGTIAGIKTGADDRAANAVAYISPSFSGFTGVVAYVNGENKTNSSLTANAVNGKQWQVAGQYDQGPLFAGLGYHHVTDNSWANAGLGLASGAEADARVIRGVVSYTLPSATKLVALYDNTKVSSFGAGVGVSGVDVKRTAYSLGVAQGFGKNTVGLEYAHSGKVKIAGASVNQTQVSILSAVYTYEMSKRTTLHARVSKLTNGDANNTNFYNNPVANTVTSGPGADYTGLMVGMRHSF